MELYGQDAHIDPHFQPPDQNLCLCPWPTAPKPGKIHENLSPPAFFGIYQEVREYTHPSLSGCAIAC